MIRRLLVLAAVIGGSAVVTAAPASAAPAVRAANGDVLCVYNVHPLNVGLCIGV